MNKSGETVREEAGMMAAAAMMIIMCASRKKKKKSFTVGFPSECTTLHIRARTLSVAVPAQIQSLPCMFPQSWRKAGCRVY